MNDPNYRTLTIDRSRADAQARTVPASLSSEAPVQTWDGMEVLSHDANAVDLTRAADGLPLLFAHNQAQPIGIVEGVHLAGRKLRGTLRFSKSAQADQVFQDVLDGTLRNLSIGYNVQKSIPTDTGYRATKWTPFEASVVSVPADQSVGIGRSHNFEELTMTTNANEIDDDNEGQPHLSRSQRRNLNASAEGERARYLEIEGMGRKFNQRALATDLIREGASLENARAAFLECMSDQQPVARSAPEYGQEIGMNDREAREFSLVRAINATITGDWRKAGLERAANDAEAKRLGRESTGGFFVPQAVLEQRGQRAAYAVGAAGTGGNIVASNLLAGSFIEILRNNAQVIRMGATMLSGLVGNALIPRQNAATTAYWVTEATAVTEAEGTFDQVSLSPKTIGCYSKYSRLTLLQTTPDIEMLIRNDLAAQLGIGIDAAAISGSGSAGQPTGVLTSATGSVVGGTNGAALTIDHMIALYSAVANANADLGNMAYLTNSKAIGALASLKSTTGEYLWARGDDMAGEVANRPDMLQGKPVYTSNNVPSNLTKGTSSGVCSAVLFGNWSDLLIGEWGTLEILANPFGSGFSAGTVEIRALQSVDIAVRHGASFAVMSDALTS